MKPSFWSVLGLCAAAACGVIQRQVRPTVRPARIPPVSPPIHARALLLIAPSFEAYVVEERISIANWRTQDRKSTRLNSSHLVISYAVFCLKKKRLYILNFFRIVTHI